MAKWLFILGALTVIVLYFFSETRPAATYATAALHQERRAKNQAFRSGSASPLPDAQKAQFDSLKYYAPDGGYQLTAELTRTVRPDTVLLQMSDNQAEKYLRWGEAQFELPTEDASAAPVRLVLYRKATGSDSTLFVPFTDGTNGRETYGGGRYLNVPLPAPAATTAVLDFNRAYNPYCAYNDAYSCPVPPAENRLTVRIPAGEKAFHD